MVPRTPRRSLVAIGAGGLALSLALAGCSAGDSDSEDGATSLTFLVDNGEATVATAEALAEAFTAENPDITIEVETRPQGADGDNVVKTRLATGEMDDIFQYNSGSLMQALSPDETLVEPRRRGVRRQVRRELRRERLDRERRVRRARWVSRWRAPSSTTRTSTRSSASRSRPRGTSSSRTARRSRRPARPPRSCRPTATRWTSQLFVLGDFNNVLAENPDWAEEYTNNEAKYVDEPALAGFEHLQEAFEKGLFNEDFASAKYADGVTHGRHRRGCAVPDAHVRGRPAHDDEPRGGRRRRHLPAAGPRRVDERPHRVDADQHGLHPQVDRG